MVCKKTSHEEGLMSITNYRGLGEKGWWQLEIQKLSKVQKSRNATTWSHDKATIDESTWQFRKPKGQVKENTRRIDHNVQLRYSMKVLLFSSTSVWENCSILPWCSASSSSLLEKLVQSKITRKSLWSRVLVLAASPDLYRFQVAPPV